MILLEHRDGIARIYVCGDIVVNVVEAESQFSMGSSR
jgi:hypothetical protein